MADLFNGDNPAFTIERLENWNLRHKKHFITFRITNNTQRYDYRMHLMPETYSLDRPARTTVVQTRGGAFIDDFGVGIGTLTVSGTTGFKRMPNNSPAFNPQVSEQDRDGFDRWKGLNDFFETWYQWKLADDTQEWQMHFLNWSENDQFVVWPVGMPKLSRSVREPLLFRYEIQLTVLDRVAKVPYVNPHESVGDTSDDVLAALDVTGKNRVPILAQRMKDQLATQSAFVGHILNSQDIDRFDPSNPEAFLNPYDGLDDATKDALVQGFINDLIQQQAPVDLDTILNNAGKVVYRTRQLANKIRDYADGTTTKIESTLGEAQATVNGWRDVLDAAEYALNLPVVYAREVKETLCAVQSLLLYPQLFRNSVSAALTELADLFLDSGCATTIRR